MISIDLGRWLFAAPLYFVDTSLDTDDPFLR